MEYQDLTGSIIGSLTAQKDFWPNYFFLDDDTRLPDLSNQPIKLVETPSASLVLVISEYEVTLFLESGWLRHQLGWADQAHFHPDVFRWEELQVLSRYVAATTPGVKHPGIPLLLLCQFTPLTRGDNEFDIEELIRAAWASLELFSAAEIDNLVNSSFR